mmetsp:Transcript_18325/g.27789  ORF Transcript_18325/g.27789 Transcript_18325/m.27789 type:complete len:545 (+) Transcript_18325:121-1755(+)
MDRRKMNNPNIHLLVFLCILLTESYGFVVFMPDSTSIVQSSRYGVGPSKDGESSDELQIKQEDKILDSQGSNDAYYNDEDQYFEQSARFEKGYIYDDEDFGDDYFDERNDDYAERGKLRLDIRRTYADEPRRNQRRRNRAASAMPQSRPPPRSRERTPRDPNKIADFNYGPASCQVMDSGKKVSGTRPDLLDDQDRINDEDEARQGSQDRQRNQEAEGNNDSDYYYSESFKSRGPRYQDDQSEYRGRRNRRRRQFDSDEDWFDFDGNPITDFIDNLFDIDRDEMDMKADEYEGLLGRRPMRSRGERRASNGYSYRKRYNDDASMDFRDDAEEEEQLIEDEVISDQDHDIDMDDNNNNDSIDSKSDEESENNADRRKPRQMSMEERARKLERVPPDGIPAWGPTGDLGLDIRTKMVMDAMDELRSVRSKVNIREEKMQLLREDIVVLRTDATLESKKQQTNPTRRGRNRLRQILLDIEDAARDLRRAQKLEAIAREELEFLQDKHWALLSLYDVDKASQEISDAFKELSSSESVTESSGSTAEKD